MRKVSTSDAREELAELVNRVAYAQEPVILTRHGKDMAALVPMGVYARLYRQAPRGTDRVLTSAPRRTTGRRDTLEDPPPRRTTLRP